jgi:4-hydroxy-3-polyprenylbenzoate decarboxylase
LHKMPSPDNSRLPVIVGITGASGAVYAERLLRHLSRHRIPVHLAISVAGTRIVAKELGRSLSSESPDASAFGVSPDTIKTYGILDFDAPMAGGTFRSAGMIIVPCSTGTLGAIAGGMADNLIRRAAQAMLKEKRPLVLVVRETPLSLIHLESCLKLAHAGATILPACPAFYHGVASVDDLVDFVLTKALDQLGLDLGLIKRWGEGPNPAT